MPVRFQTPARLLLLALIPLFTACNSRVRLEADASGGELHVRATVVGDDGRRPLAAHGAELVTGARVYVELANTSAARCYVHVIHLGVGGAVSVLTADDTPDGVAVDPAEHAIVLGGRAGAVPGRGLRWPRGIPADRPHVDELVVIATSRPTHLRALDSRTRSAGELLAPAPAVPAGGFFAWHLAYLLLPPPPPRGG
mgnify:CR=1 FL=1